MVLNTGPLDWESSILTTRPSLRYEQRVLRKHFFCTVLMNGITLNQKLEMQNLYMNSNNRL